MWCCSVLQCIQVRCSVLQRVAARSQLIKTLNIVKGRHELNEAEHYRQCVAVCCSVLQCVAVRCSALQCVAVRCSVLQRVAARTQMIGTLNIVKGNMSLMKPNAIVNGATSVEKIE